MKNNQENPSGSNEHNADDIFVEDDVDSDYEPSEGGNNPSVLK
jgi:hypothetical protein